MGLNVYCIHDTYSITVWSYVKNFVTIISTREFAIELKQEMTVGWKVERGKKKKQETGDVRLRCDSCCDVAMHVRGVCVA